MHALGPRRLLFVHSMSWIPVVEHTFGVSAPAILVVDAPYRGSMSLFKDALTASEPAKPREKGAVHAFLRRCAVHAHLRPGLRPRGQREWNP